MTHLDFTCLSPVGIWVCRRYLRRLNYHRCLTTQFIKEMHLHCTGETEVKGVLDRALGHQQSYPLALVLWLEYSGGKTSQPPSHRGAHGHQTQLPGKQEQKVLLFCGRLILPIFYIQAGFWKQVGMNQILPGVIAG